MRRRIAAMGAMLLAIVGIVVIAPESGALNTTGIHSISFDCVATGHNSTTDFTYSLTLDQVDPATNDNGARYWYTFQLLSSTFHGTTPPFGRSPSLAIGPSGQSPAGEGWLSAGFGGAQTTANYTWPRYAAVDGATLTDGINVDWTPRVISIKPNFQGNNRLLFSVYNVPGCQQYLDLGFPDAPHELGNLSKVLSCSTSPGGPFYTMYLDYSVIQVAGNTFEFHVQSANFVNDTADGNGASSVTMDIVGIGRPAAEIVDSGSSNWDNPPPDGFLEVDGLFDVTFPTITWDYQPGQHPNVGVVFTHVTDTCEASIDLDYNWNTDLINPDPAFDDIDFDDCSPTPAVLKVKPGWERTQDGDTYRLVSMQIFQSNSSASKIVLDAGNATVLGGLTLAENADPAVNLVTLNSNVTLANRTIDSGEWQVFTVNDPGKWARVSAPASHSSAPASFYTPKDRTPTVTLRAKVYSSIGVECAPAGAPGTPGNISKLDYRPSTVP